MPSNTDDADPSSTSTDEGISIRGGEMLSSKGSSCQNGAGAMADDSSSESTWSEVGGFLTKSQGVQTVGVNTRY